MKFKSMSKVNLLKAATSSLRIAALALTQVEKGTDLEDEYYSKARTASQTWERVAQDYREELAAVNKVCKSCTCSHEICTDCNTFDLFDNEWDAYRRIKCRACDETFVNEAYNNTPLCPKCQAEKDIRAEKKLKEEEEARMKEDEGELV